MAASKNIGKGERDGIADLPLLVMSAFPVPGHFWPTFRIAVALSKRGYDIVFFSSIEFKPHIERKGMEFQEIAGLAAAQLNRHRKTPPGVDMWVNFGHILLDWLPERTSRMRDVLEQLNSRIPGRRLLLICEALSHSAYAFAHGAPLPKGFSRFPEVISLGVTGLYSGGIDTGPYGLNLPPDSSESGRIRNTMIASLLERGPFFELIARQDAVLKELGCTKLPRGNPMAAWIECYKTHFQLYSPSLEYPRSDLHPSIKFAGTVPNLELHASYQYPSWWEELVEKTSADKSTRKKIITVSQGTEETMYDNLLIPTMQSCASRDDVIIIAILGLEGATLPKRLLVPANARVIDYLPYDAVLPHTDIFVSNAGLGGILHSVNHGVPMLLAGTTEDKLETACRAERAGMAINLRTQRPSHDEILTCITKLLGDPSYKSAAVKLQKENQDLDAVALIEQEIQRLARKV